MLSKIYPPFGLKGNHKITQTYHSMPTQYAVDISALVGREVFGHEGVVKLVRSDLGQLSYVALDIGEPELLFYVHIVPLVKVGQRIKMGQKIATIHKAVQYPTHLHWTFQREDRKASSMKVLDYANRSANWYATHPDIKALWCKGDGTLDWRKFGNKFVDINDNTTDLQKQIVALKAKIVKLESENKLLIERIEKLEGDIASGDLLLKEYKRKFEQMEADLIDCNSEKDRLREENKRLQMELDSLTTINGLLSTLFKKLVELIKPKGE